MAKEIMQIRYYTEGDGRNQPINNTVKKLASGELFLEYGNIIQLGIQTLPGTKFYLNDGVNPIIVGSTGIYELNLEGISPITKLAFDQGSLALIQSSPNAYLIVDIIYESNRS